MASKFTILKLTESLTIEFGRDGLGSGLWVLVTFMWLLVCIYAMKYKDHQSNNRRFFIFYGLTYVMLTGLCFAANYLTMYITFEFMTLLSMPLVLHNGTAEAISAAKKYLFYSIFGATLGLLGFFFVNVYGLTTEFTVGGVLDYAKLQGHETSVQVAALLTAVGFGAKAGLFPLHSWLPTAHPVAPAPASAVLSGVITKAGVICIIRVIYFVFGVEFLAGTFVQYTLIGLALTTVLVGSMMAYREDILKKRFAYSTVSQVSYVLLGVFLMNPVALTGALLHVVYHSVIKDGLFLSAGSIIFVTHKENVSELRGIGLSMPWTLGFITVFSLGLIGIPPFAGFLSKWYLAQGALSSGLRTVSWLSPAVLLVSALLTAAYLLPIAINGFFPGADFEEAGKSSKKKEAPLTMLLPVALLAVLVVILGVFASPLLNHVSGLAGALF